MIPIALFAPGWSLWDIYESLQSADYAEAATFDAEASYDARQLGAEFSLPFFIMNGAEDHVAPADLAKNYFDFIHAPEKQFVTLKGAGHNAVFTNPDAFLRELVARVRPVAMLVDVNPSGSPANFRHYR